MLNQDDTKYIADWGWMIDHDWELLSYVLGEAFLHEELLYYWDGAHLAICTWPVNRYAAKQLVMKHLFELVQLSVSRFSPSILEIWGPLVFDLRSVLPADYQLYAFRPPDPANVSIQIELPNYKIPNNRNSQYARAAVKKRLKFEIQQSKPLTSQHRSLTERLLTRIDLGRFERSLGRLAPHIAQLPRTVILSAYQAVELVGYILVRETLRSVALAIWGTYQNDSRRASDFLFSNMIEYYRNRGISFLDLGYSVNRDLMQYKQRWGANVNNGSYVRYYYKHQEYTVPDSFRQRWSCRQS